MANFILIMVDECGEEYEVGSYTLSLDLDEDELEIWKDRKVEQVSEKWPEACGFYWEDRRGWNSMINAMLNDPALSYFD